MKLDLLNQLDDKVQVLLRRLQQLRDEKEQLMKRLANRELHFGETSGRLREYEELRDRIKARIEGMLAGLDRFNLG